MKLCLSITEINKFHRSVSFAGIINYKLYATDTKKQTESPTFNRSTLKPLMLSRRHRSLHNKITSTPHLLFLIVLHRLWTLLRGRDEKKNYT